jgi:hypothetical protein
MATQTKERLPGVEKPHEFADSKPFEKKYVEDEVSMNDDVVMSLRLNLDDQSMIKDIKEALNISSDSMALKISARLGRNVIRSTFPPEFWEYLSREKRSRLRKK